MILSCCAPRFRRGVRRRRIEGDPASVGEYFQVRWLPELPQKGLGQGGKSRVSGCGLRMGLLDTGGVAVSVPAVHQRRGHLGLRGV